MPLAKRVKAAEAFWRDRDSPEIEAQQTEAILLLARRLNFRTKSLQALPVDRRAKHLAHVTDISDAIATRALIAYHFSSQRDLMAAFLDALGIKHENGVIADESPAVPDRDRLAAAIEVVRSRFDPADVDLYLRTLAALDGETWTNLEGLVGPLA